MKALKLLGSAFMLFSFGCAKPVAVEIKDVCSQPGGAKVIIQGFISLPQQIETIQLMRNGSVTAVGLQLYTMTKADATGDSVGTTFWTSDKGEPNKIKPLPKGHAWNDLMVYTDDGKTLGAGKMVKLTGTAQKNDKGGCDVNVQKIESP